MGKSRTGGREEGAGRGENEENEKREWEREEEGEGEWRNIQDKSSDFRVELTSNNFPIATPLKSRNPLTISDNSE